MGEVFLAQDEVLERKVAIKYLRRDIDTSDARVDLVREARLLAQLSHPNVVQVYDVIEHQGRMALVMQYIAGRNLHVQLRERISQLPELLCWLSEIAAGIAAAHDAGIVHNDLKAENVLIGADNVARVTDFGIAEIKVDESEDVLALGKLAQKMLASQDSPAPALANLLQQLNHQRASRRPTAIAAAETFRQAWLDSTQHETPVPGAPEAKRGPSRHWLVVAAAAVVALAVLRYAQFPQKSAEGIFVAVMPTGLKAAEVTSSEQQLLRSAVQQSLRQRVIETPTLALISSRETELESGTPAQIAAALGADELITSRLVCSSARNCELTIERLSGSDLAVTAQSVTSMLVEWVSESGSVVSKQWRQLYPSATPVDEHRVMSDADYKSFLRLYDAIHVHREDASTVHDQLEQLLGSARRFLPLHLLYSESTLNLYNQTGEARYLGELDEVLDVAESWAGESLALLQARVEMWFEAGKFDEAAAAISRMDSLGASPSLVRSLRGDMSRYTGNYQAAHDFYQTSLSLRPSRVLYSKIADNFRRWSRRDEAIVTLQQSLSQFSDDAHDRDLLALILIEQGRLPEAIEILEDLTRNHSSTIYSGNLALAYLLQAQYSKARQVLGKIYDSGIRNSTQLLNMADVESLSGNVESARTLYQRIIGISERESSSVPLWILSQVHAQLGQFTTAIQLLHQIKEDDAESAFSAALVYALAQQNVSAVVEVEKAIASDFGEVWFRLPWFDSLCQEQDFQTLMAKAGNEDRCLNVARPLAFKRNLN